VWSALPPVVALVVARGLTVAGSAVPWWGASVAHWARWDSGHYGAIAAEGYHFGDCAALGLGAPGALCQNVAWYPLLPALMRVAGWLGFDRDHAGVVLATGAWVAAVALVWWWWLRALPAVRALAGLALVAAFPGVVYQQALFPISLLVLSVVVWARLLERGRWPWACVAAAVGSTAYPVGLVLVPATVVALLLQPPRAAADGPPADGARPTQPRSSWAAAVATARVRLPRAAAAGLLVAAGTVAVFALHERAVGRWDASLTAQRELGSSPRDPVASLWAEVVDRATWIQTVPGNEDLAEAVALQSAVVAALVLATSAALAWAWWRGRPPSGPEVGQWCALVGMWLLPLATFVDTGLTRREATLLPFVPLAARRLPAPVLVALAGAALVAARVVSPTFFDGSLI
jgi:hypothetical protein